MDLKLELVSVPVSDVDRSIAFYTERAGFNLDQDNTVSEDLRFVQLTPPGSACSIAIGKGLTDAVPGSVRGLQLVVADIGEAKAEFEGRGLEVGEVQDFPWAGSSSSTTPTGTRGPFRSCRTAPEGNRPTDRSQGELGVARSGLR